MAARHQAIEFKFYSGANRVWASPCLCAVTALSTELVPHDYRSSGDTSTAHLLSLNVFNLPPTPACLVHLCSLVKTPGSHPCNYLHSVFSYYCCTYEMHSTRILCVWLRLGSKSDSFLNTQQCTLSSANGASEKIFEWKKEQIAERREEKVWSSNKKRHWYAAGCAKKIDKKT